MSIQHCYTLPEAGIFVYRLHLKLFNDNVHHRLSGSSPSGCPPGGHVGSFPSSRLFTTAEVDGASPA